MAGSTDPKSNMEAMDLNLLLNLSRVLYRQSMDKFTAKAEFIDPQNLQDHHEVNFQSTLEILSKTTALNDQMTQEICQALDKLFAFYEEINLKKQDSPGPAIGIDLGTTYCVVSVVQDGEPKIIFNNLNKDQTPSYISFPVNNSDANGTHNNYNHNYYDDDENENEPIVGVVAKSLAHTNPQFTIFDVKRMIGRDFNDPRIQKEMQLWPFGVIQEKGLLKIQTGVSTTCKPEEVSATLIKYLRATAESYLQTSVLNAVVAVPAYFNARQRELTKEACTMAGLNVLQLITEPTAAAIAYNVHKSEENQDISKNCLIFDLGGGTFDVAVLTMKNNHIQVKALGGDAHIGGEDFDNNMVDYCITTFKGKHGIDLTQEKFSPDPTKRFKTSSRLRRLKTVCEENKRYLTHAKEVTVSLAAIHGDLDLAVKFTRQIFEKINMDLFRECMKIVEEVLESSSLQKGDIHDLVLVGGSTRIPKVQQMLSDLFGGKRLSKEINPDEAVAIGAAMIAYTAENPEVPNIRLQEPQRTVKGSLPRSLQRLVKQDEASVAKQVNELKQVFANKQKQNSTFEGPQKPSVVTSDYQNQSNVNQMEGHLMLKKVGEGRVVLGQWQKHYLELRGKALYCSGAYQDDFTIHLEGASCSKILTGTVLRNVFGLNLLNGSKYFFQAQTEKQMEIWMDSIKSQAGIEKAKEIPKRVNEQATTLQYRPTVKPKPPPRPSRIPQLSSNSTVRKKTRWFLASSNEERR